MSTQPDALDRSVLETKARDELAQIGAALGVKIPARAKKADMIDLIISGVKSPGPPAGPGPGTTPAAASAAGSGSGPGSAPAAASASGPESAPAAGSAPIENGSGGQNRAPVENSGGKRTRRRAPSRKPGRDAEPKAEWEVALAEENQENRRGRRKGGDRNHTEGGTNGDTGGAAAKASKDSRGAADKATDGSAATGNGADSSPSDAEATEAVEPANKRRRRRGRGRDREETFQGEPVDVEGILDLRDEGYGFLRTSGHLPSKSDVYVPAKLVRQYGLRRGDTLKGTSRPAGRSEKNPGMLTVTEVNGRPPEEAVSRVRFEDLTPLFPDERLRMEIKDDVYNMTARIIDLVSPIGKGQRGLIVSPPKAGKTTIMKSIAHSIEANHPEVKLMVLLLDERPEEVTDMARSVKGEVIASTFDRPVEEHIQISELTIERAKRMVEYGEDVVIMLDGITRLARAHNLASPGTGRIMSGGVDSGALYPPKKFFGAARNLEEGGSLTILATALVETGSKMDEVIFEEFKGTGNMELRLDRRLAERRIFPAIDVAASSTRHEELLYDRGHMQAAWKLRKVLAGVAGDSESRTGAGLELLLDRLKSFRTNEEFLAEIARAPGS